MSNTTRHQKCHMRTALGNCDPIGGFCTSVNEYICEALHKASRPQWKWMPCEERLPKSEYGESDPVLVTCRHKSDGNESAKWIRLLYFTRAV